MYKKKFKHTTLMTVGKMTSWWNDAAPYFEHFLVIQKDARFWTNEWLSNNNFTIRGRIFSHVWPFYEQAVSNLDRPMHRSLWV